MADALVVTQPITIDLLTNDAPALSSTSDVPIVETKPDASNEGAPPKAEPVTIEGEAVEIVEEAEQQGESATPSTDEQSGQPAGDKPRGVGKALAELRQQRKEADARAKAAEERLEQALKSLEQVTAKPAQPDPVIEDSEPVRPTRDTYGDPDAYDRALDVYHAEHTSWIVKREISASREAERRETEAKRIETQMREQTEVYNRRKDEAKKKFADFDEVALRADVQVPMPVVHAIINDERGPELQYYFGSHPEEAKRLMSLSPASQLIELGKITARLDAPVAKPPVSSAPKPITPVKPTGESGTFDPETASPEEYAAWRRRESGIADPQAKNKLGMARTRH